MINMDTTLKQQLKDSGYTGGLDLSSLIEACGSKFHHLLNNIHEWRASGISGEFGRGNTPEEAVARLWLKLNKK